MAFFGREKKDQAIIAGCGRLGSSVAGMFSEQNHSVVVIDIDERAFRKLPPSYGGLTVTGNAGDSDILKDSDIEETAVLIACTNNDDTNIMIAQIAKIIYGVPNVIARIQDSSKLVVFEGTGIGTICPSLLSVQELKKIMSDFEVTLH